MFRDFFVCERTSRRDGICRKQPSVTDDDRLAGWFLYPSNLIWDGAAGVWYAWAVFTVRVHRYVVFTAPHVLMRVKIGCRLNVTTRVGSFHGSKRIAINLPCAIKERLWIRNSNFSWMTMKTDGFYGFYWFYWSWGKRIPGLDLPVLSTLTTGMRPPPYVKPSYACSEYCLCSWFSVSTLSNPSSTHLG